MAKSLIWHSAGLVTAVPKETATKSLLLPFPFPTPSSTTNRSSNYRSVSSSSSSSRVRVLKGRYQIRAAAETMEIEKSGIKVVNNPPESKLAELGVRSWPKWGCPPSKFPWTYSSKETCYLLKGKVKVTPEGSDEGVEFGAGDLVVFPKGMNCTWDVSEAVDKHYMFE